ncbi:MAG: hypothetical protein ACYDAD_03335 [Acidimicrobiales bacterium]
MATPGTPAELSSVATAIEELSRRVLGMADGLSGGQAPPGGRTADPQDSAAGQALYRAERALDDARRQIDKAARLLS